MRGVIFDIKRFAVHDGPGIRTTVFLKGCALRCAWCQNPEGVSRAIELWHFENRCAGCDECIGRCPEGALSSSGRGAAPHVLIDRERCLRCGRCVEVCPSGAQAHVGREVAADEVIEEVLKDRVFYEESGGGVTLSGGEPLCQPEFSLELLRSARRAGIHTVVDTALCGPRDAVEALVSAADLLLVDLKIADTRAHRRWTGEGNEGIRANFELAASRRQSRQRSMIVRVPLIPGVTATEENVRNIARYVREVRPDAPIEFVNFNPLARAKYRRMQKPYEFAGIDAPLAEARVEELRRIAREEGLTVLE